MFFSVLLAAALGLVTATHHPYHHAEYHYEGAPTAEGNHIVFPAYAAHAMFRTFGFSHQPSVEPQLAAFGQSVGLTDHAALGYLHSLYAEPVLVVLEDADNVLAYYAPEGISSMYSDADASPIVNDLIAESDDVGLLFGPQRYFPAGHQVVANRFFRPHGFRLSSFASTYPEEHYVTFKRYEMPAVQTSPFRYNFGSVEATPYFYRSPISFEYLFNPEYPYEIPPYNSMYAPQYSSYSSFPYYKHNYPADYYSTEGYNAFPYYKFFPFYKSFPYYPTNSYFPYHKSAFPYGSADYIPQDYKGFSYKSYPYDSYYPAKTYKTHHFYKSYPINPVDYVPQDYSGFPFHKSYPYTPTNYSPQEYKGFPYYKSYPITPIEYVPQGYTGFSHHKSYPHTPAEYPQDYKGYPYSNSYAAAKYPQDYKGYPYSKSDITAEYPQDYKGYPYQKWYANAPANNFPAKYYNSFPHHNSYAAKSHFNPHAYPFNAPVSYKSPFYPFY